MKRTARGLVARSLTAAALVVFYCFGALGIATVATGVPKAEARGRRGGRGFRGFRGGRRGFRGRRGGFWWGGPAFYTGYYDDGCYWSPRRGRYICPYSYYPGYYRYW